MPDFKNLHKKALASAKKSEKTWLNLAKKNNIPQDIINRVTKKGGSDERRIGAGPKY